MSGRGGTQGVFTRGIGGAEGGGEEVCGEGG